MTTTRINHTGHGHANTTAARTACRKAMKVTVPVAAPVASVGAGRAIHAAVMADGHLIGVRCGAGLARNGRDSDYRIASGDVTCTRCTKLS